MTAGARQAPEQQDPRPAQTPFHRFGAGDDDAPRRPWSNDRRVPHYTPYRLQRPQAFGGRFAGIDLLTGLQVHALWVVRIRTYSGRGPTTLRDFAPLIGVSSPGRAWHVLNALRWRGLIGFKGHPGRYGRLDIWLPKAGRDAIRRTLAERPGTPRIDSIATPFGGFLSREGRGGLADSWPKRYADRLEEGARRRGPPGRTYRLPPMFLTKLCPNRHSVRLQRTTYGITARRLTGRWEALCRHCRQWIVELVEVTVPLELIPRRPLTVAEQADPNVRRRRVEDARRLVADPSTDPRQREQLQRDYLDDPAGDLAASKGPLGGDLERLLRGRPRPP